MAHILLIEPDHILAGMYAAVLERAGHTVSRQVDAQNAILAADESRPDLVLMELNLAGHNGVEFLYEFRSYPDWLKIPVIVLSMTPPEEIKAADSVWQRLGIAAHHYKPAARLWDVLRSVETTLASRIAA